MTEMSIAPADFDPYRDQIRGCFCPEYCRPMMYAASLNSGAGNGGAEHAALGVNLLEALNSGAHVRMTESQYRASVAPAPAAPVRHQSLFERLA
jgi:hypothetical protein